MTNIKMAARTCGFKTFEKYGSYTKHLKWCQATEIMVVSLQ